MKIINSLIIIIILLIFSVFFWENSPIFIIFFIGILIFLEIISHVLVNKLREEFQWLITQKDENPKLSETELKKFFKQGYDPELGWIRNPNTHKEEIGKFRSTKYNIDSKGSRKNPGHEKLPKKISFYGDSFLFGRQVNDNETCQWYLSKLTRSNIANFSVGNYGLDQALLRLKREYPKNKTNIVIMGVVPSTIVRILSMWKHYNEYGNTFGFKPRFIIEKEKLKLIKNYIDSEKKFYKYEDYLPEIRKHDYFYKTKFKEEMIRFPYLISILSDSFRVIPLIFLVSKNKWFRKDKKSGGYPNAMKKIMEINLELRYDLFSKNMSAVILLEKMLKEFSRYGKEKKFKPIFLLMPQKDDLLFIRKKKKSYYENFIKKIEKNVFTIDLTKNLINRNDLDKIYSDDNKYGGHYSSKGNELIAKIIYEKLKNKEIVK